MPKGSTLRRPCSIIRNTNSTRSRIVATLQVDSDFGCLCGEADRLDSTGMSGPRGSAQPRAPTSIAEELHGLLSSLADTLGVRQGCARATGDHAARRAYRDTASGGCTTVMNGAWP